MWINMAKSLCTYIIALFLLLSAISNRNEYFLIITEDYYIIWNIWFLIYFLFQFRDARETFHS